MKYIKRLLLASFYLPMLLLSLHGNAADRSHEGLYCQLGIGPSFGHIHDKYTEEGVNKEVVWKGTGTAIDFRVGGFVRKDWLLTFDGYNQFVSSPEVSSGSFNGSLRSEESISEVNYGLGMTRYFMPSNIYAGITMGAGTYVLEYYADPNNTHSLTKVRSDYGLSGMLRAGKTFFLGKHWGLGVGTGYTFLKCKTTSDGETEQLSSRKFLLTVNVTYE
jgi:hypothetical protein